MSMTIQMYAHCRRCLAERPEDQSPREWARLQAGWNENGDFEVECVRHEMPVVTVQTRKKRVAR
jgi:hypothetical protein